MLLNFSDSDDIAILPTRQRFIHSATRLFQQRGYHAVGLSDILKAASAPKGSLYHHFPGGKAALAVACIDTMSKTVHRHLQEQQDEGLSCSECIQAMFTSTTKWMARHDWQEGSLFSAFTHELSDEDELIADALEQASLHLQDTLAQMLRREGMSRKEARLLAQLTLINFDGAISVARAQANRRPMQAAASLLEELYQR